MITGDTADKASESTVYRVDAHVSVTITADPTVLAQRHAERVKELEVDGTCAANGCRRSSDTEQIIEALQKAIMLAGEKVIETIRGPKPSTEGN